MTVSLYTPAQRDAFIAAIKPGPIRYSMARDAAGLPDAVAGEILAAGHKTGLIAIEDHGPTERGMLEWRGE